MHQPAARHDRRRSISPRRADGTGDLPLTLTGAPKLGYLRAVAACASVAVARRRSRCCAPCPMLRGRRAGRARLPRRQSRTAGRRGRIERRTPVPDVRARCRRHERHAAHADQLPRGTLVIAGALVLFAFAATSIVRIAAHPRRRVAGGAARGGACRARSQSRNLRFIDRADGAVVIQDVDDGRHRVDHRAGPADRLHPRRDARARARAPDRAASATRRRSPSPLWRDGELSLTDSATGRSIELDRVRHRPTARPSRRLLDREGRGA